MTAQQPQQIESQGTVAIDTRKSWVTPVVSESPVNELTEAGSPEFTIFSDGVVYS